MKKPSLKERLVEAEAKLNTAETLMRALRWYVQEHGALPPGDSWSHVAGPRGYAFIVFYTNAQGIPVRFLDQESEIDVEETFLSSCTYDPKLSEEIRGTYQARLDSLRNARRALTALFSERLV